MSFSRRRYDQGKALALMAAVVAIVPLLSRALWAESGYATTNNRIPTMAAAASAGAPVLNVRSFGATGIDDAFTVRTIAGSRIIKLANSGRFSPGQSVMLIHAGGPSNLRPPVHFIAQAMTYGELNAVDKPGCTASAWWNQNCSTEWDFSVEAVDVRGGISPSTAVAAVSRGPVKPNPTSRIKLVWDSVPEAAGYLVYGCSGDGCTPSLIAVLPNNWYLDDHEQPCAGCQRPRNMVFWYMGKNYGADQQLGTKFSRDGAPQDLFTRATSAQNESVTLADAPGISGQVQMGYDDSPAFQAAIDRARSTHAASIFIPQGKYPIGQTLDFYRTAPIHVFGAGSEGSSPSTALVWRGAPGGTVLSLVQAREHLLEDFSITDVPNGSTPGTAIDIDSYDRGGNGGGITTTHNRFYDLGIGRSGIGVRLGNRSNSNCEMMEFRDVMLSPYGPGWYGYYIAGGTNTLDEKIDGGSIGPRQVAIFLNSAGSVDAYALNLNNNQIDWYVNRRVVHVLERGSDSEHTSHHLYLPFASPDAVRIAIYDSRFYDYPQTVASNGF